MNKMLKYILIIIVFTIIFSIIFIFMNRQKEDLLYRNETGTLEKVEEKQENMNNIKNVSMEIKEGTLTKTGATVVITDKNETPYSYGEWFRIDEKDGDKWKEVEQITDNYGITVSNARSALNDYTKSGCIDEDSDEYKEYENIINNLEDEVDDIDTNIDRQNGVSEGDWQFLGEDPEFGSTEIGCDSLFDTTTPGAFGWILKTILNYVKVIGPILVVLLSAIDFIKAVIGTDEKAMKEAQNKLIIRLVAAVALFLVPTLVQLLLSFINQTYCAI